MTKTIYEEPCLRVFEVKLSSSYLTVSNGLLSPTPSGESMTGYDSYEDWERIIS